MSPAQSPSVCIDYAAFPNIVERVLSCCSRSDLHTARLVSRSLLLAADALLGEHLILDSVANTVGSPYGRVPSCMTRDYMGWSKPGGRKRKAALERAKGLLKRTQVVDLIGMGSVTLVPIRAAMTNVRVLRLRRDHEGTAAYKAQISARKVVLFAHPGAPVHVAGKFTTVLPPGLDKAVVHVSYHLPAESVHIAVELDDEVPSDLPELVVIFHPRTFVSEEGLWSLWVPKLDAVYQDLAKLIAVMLQRTKVDNFHVTLVGEPFDSGSFSKKLLSYVEKQLLVLGLDGSTFETVEDTLSRVFFLDYEKYRERIGDHEFLLETSEVLVGKDGEPPLRPFAR